jgi:hypothetical protein
MTSHVVILPFSKERNDEVSSELSSKNLSEEVNVRHESSLQNNWNVGSVEQLDWVWLSESSHFLAAQRELNSESLEIDDDQSDNHGREQVAKVWGILSINSLLKSVKLVWLGQQEVEESDDASFEFGSLISSNGDWGEAFPEDTLADIGGNEEGDTRSETVSLLEELIKHKHHESSQEKLGNDQKGSDQTKFTNWSIHS